MKKRFNDISRLIGMVCILSMLFLISGCVSSNNPANSEKSASSEKPASSQPAEKKIIIKYGTSPVGDHPTNLFARKLSEIIKEKTNSRIEIQVYDSDKLGTVKERLEGLKVGTVDATQCSLGALEPYEKVMTIFDSPYILNDQDHQMKVYGGEVGKEIAKLLQKHGFIALEYLESGGRQITNSKRPITKPEDLKGLSLRVPQTKSSIDAFQTLGASPIPMQWSEVYMALQQKVVDGQENPFANIVTAKLYEVQKYLSLTNHQRTVDVSIFSELTWRKLSKEDQDIIVKAGQEAHKYMTDLVIKQQTDLLNQLKEKGMEINEVDVKLFKESVKPLREQYIKDFGQQAKDFFDMIDKAQ